MKRVWYVKFKNGDIKFPTHLKVRSDIYCDLQVGVESAKKDLIEAIKEYLCIDCKDVVSIVIINCYKRRLNQIEVKI